MSAPDRVYSASIKSFDFEIAAILTDDDGNEATNISGVSCLAPEGSKHVCLVIDDQGRLAQAATIDGSRFKGGGKIKLFDKVGPPADIVGKAPVLDNCSEKAAKFKDMDGEAVAHYKQDFYIVGSHGCSRNSNKFRTSSFILARVPDVVVAKVAAGDPKSTDESGPIATSFRLSEALLVSPHAKELFSQDLMTKNGLNIEGVAVVEGKLYAGLRGPVINKKAYLIEVDLDTLFDVGRTISLGTEVREIELDFLDGRGIRDLAVLEDGRLIVLSGPAQADAMSFALHSFDPKNGVSKPVAELGDVPSGAKAEGIHVLAQEPSKLEAVIVFDGPKSGGARRYSIELD
jgi:hypothetical protein